MPWRSSPKPKSKRKTKRPIPCRKDTFCKTWTIPSSWSCISPFKTQRNCISSWTYFRVASFSSSCENIRNFPKRLLNSMLLRFSWRLSIYTRKTSSTGILNLKIFFLIRMDISNLLILVSPKLCSPINKWPIVFVEHLSIFHLRF